MLEDPERSYHTKHLVMSRARFDNRLIFGDIILECKVLKAQRNEKRRSLFEAQDKVDQQRETLIATIEGELTQNSNSRSLFTIRWILT